MSDEQFRSKVSNLVDLLCYRAERHSDSLAYRFLETGDVTGPAVEWSCRDLCNRALAIAA